MNEKDEEKKESGQEEQEHQPMAVAFGRQPMPFDCGERKCGEEAPGDVPPEFPLLGFCFFLLPHHFFLTSLLSSAFFLYSSDPDVDLSALLIHMLISLTC